MFSYFLLKISSLLFNTSKNFSQRSPLNPERICTCNFWHHLQTTHRSNVWITQSLMSYGHRGNVYNVVDRMNVLFRLFKLLITKPNFASKLHTCQTVTPSIPLKAVTREIGDAIHTRTTVSTIVISVIKG